MGSPELSMTLGVDGFGLAGIGATAKGVLDVANGDILKGSKVVWYGTTSIGCYSSMRGFDPIKITQGAFALGLTVVGVDGIKSLARGVRQLDVLEILRGSLQIASSAAGAAIVYNLDSKTLLAAYQALGIALPSLTMARMGVNDVLEGNHGKGLCKIVVGLGGVASAGYYAYNTYAYQESESNTLSPDQIAFLEGHKNEIEEMYTSHKSVGNWTKLGSGVSKQAFAHPEIPDLIIKVPGSDGLGTWNLGGEWNMRQHHANMEELKPLAASFDRVVLPTSHLYQTSQGVMIVEQKFNIRGIPYETTDADMQRTMAQFDAFQEQASLCDLNPYVGHNAGILSTTQPPVIGVIDVDCRYQSLQNIDPHIALLVVMMTILDLTYFR